jgi:molybdopterin-containing oxidoreductase family iron-sulfur binding subunit
MRHNPDVTVRAKGVIEKCSFCVQRIQEKKLTAKNEGRTLQDGELQSACQQACPSNAIVFGDLNDPDSKVSKFMNDPRNYHLLEELHTLPSVGYLTKIRNKS